MFAFLALAHAEDLFVSSNERGAAIYVNGVDTGAHTPATVPGVKPGQVLVAVEGSCSRGEALVNVLSGLTTRVSIVAEEEPGSIVVVPVPATAKIELDGAPYMGAPGVPYGVACGSHTLRASAEGYVTAVVTVDVEMGQSSSVPISLMTLGTGSIELSVQPRAATLFLDGKAVGTDAASLPSVYQGVHTISAELDGYQAASKQVIVEDGSAQAFHFELVRSSARKQKSTVRSLGGEPEEAPAEEPGSTDREREEEREAAALAAAEARAKADAKAKADAAAKAKADAAKARAEAEEREAEERDAEARAAREAEERDAEERAAREAEEREAQERAVADAEARAKADAAAKAKADAAAKAKAEAAAKAKADAAAKARADAEEREAEEREAEERAARDAEEREAEERAARDAEEREAEERAAARAKARAKAEAEARAAEEAERREAEQREAEEREAEERATARRREDDDPPRTSIGQVAGGVSLLAGGLGSGAFAAIAYGQAVRAYDTYNEKVDNAGPDKQRQRLADEYYDDTVVPRRNLFYGTAAAGGLLLVGGVVVLVVDERLPTLAPAPGGGMLLWSGRF